MLVDAENVAELEPHAVDGVDSRDASIDPGDRGNRAWRRTGGVFLCLNAIQYAVSVAQTTVDKASFWPDQNEFRVRHPQARLRGGSQRVQLCFAWRRAAVREDRQSPRRLAYPETVDLLTSTDKVALRGPYVAEEVVAPMERPKGTRRRAEWTGPRRGVQRPLPGVARERPFQTQGTERSLQRQVSHTMLRCSRRKGNRVALHRTRACLALRPHETRRGSLRKKAEAARRMINIRRFAGGADRPGVEAGGLPFAHHAFRRDARGIERHAAITRH